MKVFVVLCVLLLNLSEPSRCLQTYNADTKTVTFTTDGDVNMILLGDWGGLPVYPYYSPYEYVTARQLMKKAELQKTDFLLALGDNFYFGGVTDEYDTRFQTTFENVFSQESFKDVPWFVIAGNHDHYGNITGELEYSKHSKRWNFPSLWYNMKVKTPTFNATIVMVDTILLCGNALHDKHTEQPIIENRNDETYMEQMKFIEAALKDNNDSYVFVAGHFPVWSVAEHGPTDCLVDNLRPLFEKYKVSGYFCGHDHNLQHLREPGSSVEYFLSGAGDFICSDTRNLNSVPQGSLKFHTANPLSMGGFATLHLNKDDATLLFETGLGSSLYKHQFSSRLEGEK